jgi:WD40 repeat protein
VWDAGSGEAVATIDAGRRWVWALAFSRDGHTLATSGFYAPVTLWDLTALKRNPPRSPASSPS